MYSVTTLHIQEHTFSVEFLWIIDWIIIIMDIILNLAGKTGREAASKTLENEPIGSYLVRLSAKLWGYTVSVKSKHTL